MSACPEEPRSARHGLWVVLATALAVSGAVRAADIRVSTLDSAKYFHAPRDAAFVDDIQRGALDRVTAALKAGQDLNVVGAQGFRPIHFVFLSPDTRMAELLLNAGADPNAALANGKTPLHYAVQAQSPDFAAVLLRHRADPNARCASNEPVVFAALSSPASDRVLPLLARAGAHLNTVWGGYTPLQAAMVQLRWVSAATLLTLGADPRVRSERGETSAEVFCRLIERMRPTATNRKAVWTVGQQLRSKGIELRCEAKLAQFD